MSDNTGVGSWAAWQAARENKIGYANPPKHSQFKKGQSGNPKGRKPRMRAKDVPSLIVDELNVVISVREGDHQRSITKREALVTNLINDAIKGKPSARLLLMRLIDPKPAADPFVSNEDDEKLLGSYLNGISGGLGNG